VDRARHPGTWAPELTAFDSPGGGRKLVQATFDDAEQISELHFLTPLDGASDVWLDDIELLEPWAF
jgi:hypothetical protein